MYDCRQGQWEYERPSYQVKCSDIFENGKPRFAEIAVGQAYLLNADLAGVSITILARLPTTRAQAGETMSVLPDDRPVRCLITAGPTREYLDPVRYLSNSSSGKMGYSLAAAAVR